MNAERSHSMPASRQFFGAVRVAMLAAVPLGILAAASPLAADWQSVGALTPDAPEENQITFRGPRTTVNISVLAQDLVRVRATSGASFGPDYSWAVIKTSSEWPKVAIDFQADGDDRVIRTSELEVRVRLNPFRVAFYDRQGHLISKDNDSRGVAWEGSRVRAWKAMPDDEHYFGLGEKTGPLDRRGHAYVMWNSDVYGWGANSDPLYEDIPFFIGLDEGRAYGLFFDNTYRSSFDFGVEAPDVYSFGAEAGEMNYYFFWGPDPKKVLARYTELVGRTPMPPLWAIGYHQCRYSYYPDRVVRLIADNFRIRHIPCDAIFLDIHYMDGYRIFTWDKSRFPDPAGLTRDLHREGFHVVTIIDPGVKVDPNYWVYQQGLAGNDFVKRPDGKLYAGKVWPGKSAFPDFTWDRVREWWGSLFKALLDDGVDGIWNDMNEPAVFEVPGHTMPDDVMFYDYGLASPESKVHNVYGMEMSRGTREGLLRLKPNERPLVITRATYAGGQRYAAVWTGDNSSTWDHLRMSVPEIMGMGLSGLALAGADIGGFVGSPTGELYTRWLEAGVFYPYCRTHTELGSQNQDPWSYGNEKEAINRQSIGLRYRLLPYLYNAFHQTSETGLPVMRALLLDYPNDPAAVGQSYEFLFGDDLLVSPVLDSGKTRWGTYLPKGVWYDFWTDRRYTGPAEVDVDAPLDRVPIFVRGGAIIPARPVVEYVSQAPINPLTFEIYPDGPSSRDYYEDDGISFDFGRGVSLEQRISLEPFRDALEIRMTARKGSYAPPSRALLFKIHAEREAPSSVTADGQALEHVTSLSALEAADSGWAYEEDANSVAVKIPDSSRGSAIRIALRNRNL